jgi:prepilin-type N-terminal cleavage/methylation domain-containing protein/prepilin-type processing-associated H-X9-DG protein
MKRGFTLIELLVVIAIIAILAAILFPVFAKAREKARQTSCLSNEKEIVLALLMYVQDYDERFPHCWNGPAVPGVRGQTCLGWQHVVQPYIKNSQIMKCPSYPTNGWNPSDNQEPNNFGYAWDYVYPTYGANYNYIVGVWRALAEIAKPSETILISELWGDNVERAPSDQYYAGGSNIRASHNDGLNLGFCDGHAKWMKLTTLLAGQGALGPEYFWYSGDK